MTGDAHADLDVSIIIPTKNAGDRFETVVRRLNEQTYPGNVERLIVDSGSDDGTVRIAEQHGFRTIKIDPEEFHHGRTRNLGAEATSGDLLVYLTQDAVPTDETWLQHLVDPHSDPDVAAVYGRQIAYPDAKPMEQFFYSYFYPQERRQLTRDNVADQKDAYLDAVFLSDACSAIDRNAWERLRFHSDADTHEDKEFAFRLLETGDAIVYQPFAPVYHSHDYTLRELWQRRCNDGAAYADIATEGRDDFVFEGLRYFLHEMWYLMTQGYQRWIPYALVYDAVYFLAFQTGKHRESNYVSWRES